MKQLLIGLALLAMDSAATAAAPLEGHWTNPKHSVIVKVAPCGGAYCGTVVQASPKAKASARRGGTAHLIGTPILSGVRPRGDGVYLGRAFDPKRNIKAPATIRVVGPNTLEVRGCIIGGVLCKTQRWTRIS
jgi:uncharacterized protein (DUF2147 family)